MNPFTVLEDVQQTHLNYVRAFQKFQNPATCDWVAEWEE
jgi:hypothetical protein